MLTPGTLIARRTWNTVKRQWFNDSYDTQGRTMEVRDGFLVRAGTKLELYSSGMQLLRSYELHDDGSGAVKAWSVAVAPGGNTIHIQPSKGPAEVRHSSVFHFTGGDETEGVWLRSDSFQKVYSQMDLPGPHSVSDNAVATRRVHCLELHSVGEPTRSLCCSGACGDGIPTFLSNHEILSVYRSGFSVLSTNGNELWNRNAAGSKGLDLEDQARSMNGLRFAISATSSE